MSQVKLEMVCPVIICPQKKGSYEKLFLCEVFVFFARKGICFEVVRIEEWCLFMLVLQI